MKRKTIALLTIIMTLLGMSTLAHAYNGKFSFKLSSGFMSHWSYSDAAYKVTNTQNPVVQTTYTSGATSTFIYDVVNSNFESRVVQMRKTGTFSPTAFSRNTAVAGYRYKLRIKRDGAQFWDSATAEGLWNPDSY